jgi:hypothetical protein
MSKETGSREAETCQGCGNVFAFIQYHWPHCPANPENLDSPTLRKMEAVFSKSELAQIALQGPQHDQRFGNLRRKGRARA